MKRHVWMVWLAVLAAVFGVAAAFAKGGADEAADDTADNVFLGEQDLAERMEIWRNQYRRMTPVDAPLIQDVGTWPAAWEEFSRAWDAASAERDLATWLVPVVSERTGSLTVLRDANGNALWSGATDFAKEGSESVTLRGALVSEEDWTLWEATRKEIARRLQESATPRLRDGEGGGGSELTGLRFVSVGADFTNTPSEYRVGLAWTNSGTLDVFAYGPLHVAETNEVTYTNDQNVIVNTNVVTWHSVEPGLSGFDNDWTWVGTLVVTNSETNVFVDTSFTEDRAKVRFYAVAPAVDSDGDGLNDGFELFVSHSDPDSLDGDGDGVDDPTEISMGLDPNDPDTDGDGAWDGVDPSPGSSNAWWIVCTTTNQWTTYGYHYLGNQTSWSQEPERQDSLIVTGARPHPDAFPGRVTLWGLVDDAITVDDNHVEGTWTNGAKVFSNLDVTACITNLAYASFRVDLYDWPDLPNGGENEARLGRQDYPFRAEWEWWTPIEVQMEPVWTDEQAPLDNPSGIILGSNAWFQVDVWPHNMAPETNVVWKSKNDKLTFPVTNRGARVQVYASEEGADELSVEVEGALGTVNIPPFHVQVKPLTVITAVVGVVELADGTAAVNLSRVSNDIETANRILQQAGMQIAWSGNIQPIQELQNTGYWNVLDGSTAISNLCSTLSCLGGLEIYYVNSITRESGGNAAGLCKDIGILISAGAAGRTVPHEIFHACGASDLYWESPNQTTQLSDIAEEILMPDDWGRYRYGAGWEMPQSEIVQRLLMYGSSTNTKGDIPTGRIYGLQKWRVHGNLTYGEGMGYVGLSAMTNTPLQPLNKEQRNMKTGNTKTSIWLCMAALFSLATAWGEGLATTEDQAVPSDFRVLDLSKVPILHGRDGKMRAVLESIVDTEYCGEALAEGVTHVAALCGMAPVKGIGFVKLDEKDWPVVLTEMANEEFERLLQEGKLHSIMDVKRLRNMIGLLGTARCDAAPILAFFRKMAERATPKWQTVLFMSISCAWIDLTIEKDGAEKSLELGRILESSCGTDSMITGIFLEQLGWCDAFGRCKTQEDLAALSRFVMEVAEKCQNEGRASSIDSIAAGEAYFHPAEDDTASFTIGKPKMGVPGWKGSIQRKRLAERFKDEPAKPSTYRIDADTGERIYPAPTQRDIDRMIWSRAASELATEDSELTDLREVYGDWTKEKTEE